MLMHLSMAVSLLLSPLGAPAQDAKRDDAGQMREIRSALQNQGQDSTDPAKTEENAKPAANPPITANQPAGDKQDPAAAPSGGANAQPPRPSLIDQDPEPRRGASASEVLKRLQQERPNTPIIPPQMPNIQRNARTTIAPEAIPDNSLRPVDQKLLPDGSRIVDRAGRLARDGDYLTFSFESRGEGPVEVPLRLLPNRLLEDMEQISEGGRKSIVFVVSGEVTEYRGVNYLLLQKLLMRPELGNFR